MLIPLVRTQILAIAVELPQHWDNVQLRLREVFPPWVIDTFSPGLKAKVPEITSSLFDFAANLSGFVGKVLSFSFDTVLVMIISFFLAKEDGLILRFINQYVHPGKRADIGALVSGILSKLGQWGFAQILSALYFGAVFWAFLFCFGIPYATTICLMGTLFEAIVPFGSVCALGLALFVATVHLPSWGPYVVLGAYLLTTFTQNHVFVPRLMNHFFKLHSLMTILAMWILYLIMGVIGTLLAMPVTVIAMDVFYYLRPRWDEDETAVSSAPEPDQLPPPDTSKVQRTIKPKLVTGRPRPKRRRAGR
jgi:predicted PurR-regulated permease PerM